MQQEHYQLVKSLRPEERELIQQQEEREIRAQVLQAELDKPGNKRLQDIGRKLEAVEEERMAKTSAPKKGRGFRKPPKRQIKVSQEEKKKDRLRLVIAQIQAGNTNPKLIQEVNKLYKDLYNIEGAYMLIKK